MSKNMSDIEEIIKIVDDLISNFDPIPLLEIEKFPLRWEAEIFIDDYDFNSNILNLDEDYEHENENFLNSVGTAIEIRKYENDSYEFWDGPYFIESHSWINKLNENDNYPSLTLINKKFKDLNGLKTFLQETYE